MLALLGTSATGFSGPDGVGFGVADSYPAYVTAPTGPTPGYALALESQSPLPKSTNTVPGLGASPAATLFLVFNKAAAAQQQHVLAAIATQDGVYASLLYGGANSGSSEVQGLGLNTYVAASSSLPGTPLDNEKYVLVRAKMYNPGPGNGALEFSMALNGVLQNLFYRGAQQSHTWGNTFVFGGFLPGGPPLDWQGAKLACYLYLSDLSEADCQRTESYLRGLYPAVN